MIVTIKTLKYLSLILLFLFIVAAIYFLIRNKEIQGKKITTYKEKITENKSSLLTNINYSKADSFCTLRYVDSAIVYYKIASQEFHDEHKIREYINTLNKIGWCYILKKEYSTALSHSEECSKFALKNLKNNDTLLSDLYFNMGKCYHWMEIPDKSLEMHQKSLKIRKKNFGDNHIDVVNSYLGLGDLYNWLFLEPYKALDNYHKALNILEKLPSETKKIQTQAKCYYSLAVANRKIWDYDKALSYCFATLRILADSSSLYKVYEEICYSMIANIYLSKKDYQNAIKYYEKAIDFNQKNYTSKNSYVANNYNNLGLALIQKGAIEKAIRYCLKAENIYNLLSVNSVDISYVYEYLGYAYQKLKKYDIALKYYYNCLTVRITQAGKKHQKTSEAYLYLGELYAEMNKPDSALKYFQHSIISGINNFNNKNIFSIPDIKSIDKNYYLREAFYQKAKLLKTLFDNTKNLKYLQASMKLYTLTDTLITLSRNYYDQDATKLLFAENTQTIYENALNTAHCLFNSSNDNKTILSQYFFNFLEKNRARILFDNYVNNDILIKSILPDSIKQQEKQLKYQLSHYQTILEKEEQKKDKDSAYIKKINSELFDIYRNTEKINELLKKSYPNYYYTKYEKYDVELKKIQSIIVSNSKIIEYFWGNEAVYAITITKNNIKLFKIKRNDSLDNSIKIFNKLIDRFNVLSKSDFILFTKYSNIIYELLLNPLLPDDSLEESKKYSDIIIIPDGELAYLPFESLLTSLPNSDLINYKYLDYLINRYVISYAFSCRLLSQSLNSTANKSVRNIFALGFSGSKLNTTGNNIFITNKKTNSLLGSNKEIQEITHLLKGKFYLGENASETHFKKLCKDYDMIHLAVHGSSNREEPLSSYLQFANTNDSLNDGKLYLYELFPLNLKAKLTVLSACETGIGKVQPGEGLLSMGWGFTYAGCPSIIHSLWKANDKSTSEIMKYFYRELSMKKTINNALHESKIYYIKNADEYTAHPALWAAFVPYGDMKPLKFQQKKLYWWIISVVIFVGMLMISIKLKNKFSDPL